MLTVNRSDQTNANLPRTDDLQRQAQIFLPEAKRAESDGIRKPDKANN